MDIHFEPPDVKWSNGQILYCKVFLQKLSLRDGRTESIIDKIKRFTGRWARLYYHEYGLYRAWVQCFNKAGGSPSSKVVFLDLKYDPKSSWFMKDSKDLNRKFVMILSGSVQLKSY